MTAQMKTLTVILSDAEIRRNAELQHVRDLRDARHPSLHFRYKKDRTRGSWYLVVRSGWKKIASYPDLNTKGLLTALPAVRIRLAEDPAASVSVGTWKTVGELLDWFSDRMSRDRSLSAKRKGTAKAAIKCHLRPKLGDLLLTEVTRANLDTLLMWPLQEQRSLAYVRLMFGLLIVGFRQAAKLDMIETNPMAAFRFVDFTKARIKTKPARLRGVQVEQVLGELSSGFDDEPADCMLALMMLCHGTRVGETRQARWSHISLTDRQWFIPAENTKTRCEHTLPLTDQACALLRRYKDAQALRRYEGAYLFPARNGKPISETQGCAVFTRLGKGEWTSHDLRKVARTGWMDLGVDYLVGEMLVNHTMTRNVKTYIHTAAEALKREALETWHEWLDGRGFAVIHRAAEARFENSHNATKASTAVASSDIKNP